jgi:selenocysteine lyase/cysteine desulfurase
MTFKNDETVVIVRGDYPSNVLPWLLAEKNRGLKVKMIDLIDPTVDGLKKVIPTNAKLLNLSYVTFDTGRKIDLISMGKFLKERGIYFVVDLTQAFGGLNLTAEELKYIDVFSCSSYKWLTGPYGHAFGYVKSELIDQIQYTNASWTKSPNSKNANDLVHYTIETLPGARKFDRGQPANMLINAALEASLEVLSEIGLQPIQNHNQKIRDFFLENYPKNKYQLITPPDHMGNIIALKLLSGDSEKILTELKHQNIDISMREGKLRISFHLFNTMKQVETIIKALDI